MRMSEDDLSVGIFHGVLTVHLRILVVSSLHACEDLESQRDHVAQRRQHFMVFVRR